MPEINARDFIEELRFDIREKDMIKAKLVLSKIGAVDDSVRKMALFELNRADDAFTIPLIVNLVAEHRDLARSYPQLKEILYAKSMYHPDMLLAMLTREVKRENRVVLVEVAGEIRLEEGTPQLMGILNEDEDELVIKAVIAALGMIGETAATTPISEYLYSGSLELTIAAIYALGQLATPTAFQRLAEKLGADSDLDIMIMDVFTADQSPAAIERLNEALSSHFAHLRNAAKQRMRDMGGKAVPILISNLLHDDPDLLIHTLNVLGEIADESAIVPIRKLLHNEPKDANVRFAAYEALGLLPVEKGAVALAQGLSDPVENVRAAAAAAIDRNYNTMLAAGLKNLIRAGAKETRQVTETVLNAGCETIFLGLLEEAPFQTCAVDFLCREAHPDVRAHFVGLMEKNGHDSLAARVSEKVCSGASPSLKVFAVDDSKMILNIYRGILHRLGCEPKLFEFPAEALKAVKSEPPEFIFTDLNMPHINGLELIREVRRQFDKTTLPIVMVTTQNETQDNEAAVEAGVNAILHKPFTAEDLGKVMADLGKLPESRLAGLK
ncbi:HEAT repeat domain-containing protein [uncultured Desulfosarcina sp.]|uniref:HEAT repeat domain-containing protein n=1 Tax=uncultured Desulfosarcina sp. TaxID=218289 RepID=UPI0029C68C53|nr:HEAT repeat domain-containing protein [uncultured Desulfosarcina sp.]